MNWGMEVDSAYNGCFRGLTMFVWEFSHENGEPGIHYNSSTFVRLSIVEDFICIRGRVSDSGIPDSNDHILLGRGLSS